MSPRNEFMQDWDPEDASLPLDDVSDPVIEVEVAVEVPDEVIERLRAEKDLTATASALLRAREKDWGRSGE